MRTRFGIRGILLGLACVCIASAGAIAELEVEVGAGGGTGIAVPPPGSPGAGESAGGEDVLLFMNKDKLHGALMAIAPEKFGLRWQHPGIKKPIEMSVEGVSSVKLAGRPAPKKRSHTALVKLTNDDVLNGDIVSLDGDHLVLDTWYAGRINVKRSMLKTMSPSSGGGATSYEGPKDISSWKMTRSGGTDSWVLKNGALYALQSSRTIGRNIDSLGDLSSIQFKATWRGYPQFYFAFYTDNLQNYYGNCYMLQISGSSLYLQRYSKHGSQRNLGSVNMTKFNNSGGSAVFRMLVDRKKKQFTLLVDGAMTKQWTDSAAFAGQGKGILFRPQSSQGLKISDIRISEWDGKVPQAIGGGGKQEEDLIRFANNDKVSGTLGSIKNGVAKFKTAYATLDIPVERIGEIELSSLNAERARRNKEDVKARFATGGVITLRLTGLSEGMIEGESENYGDIRTPVSAFENIEFNIYKEKSSDDDSGMFF